MGRLLTQAQFARKTKYSRARISQLVKAGIIQLKNGRIEPAQANTAIEANIDRSRRAKSELQSKKVNERQLKLIPDAFNADRANRSQSDAFNTHRKTDFVSLTNTRQQHEAVKMELSKIKLEIEKGNLVPKNQASEWLSLLVNNAKLRLLGLPKRMAGLLAVISNEKEIEYKLRTEIREILQELGTPLRGKKKSDEINATSTVHPR